MGSVLYTIERNAESDPWKVYEVRILPDIKHRTKGTRIGHARVQSTEDETDVWDTPYRNLDKSRAEADTRCSQSN